MKSGITIEEKEKDAYPSVKIVRTTEHDEQIYLINPIFMKKAGSGLTVTVVPALVVVVVVVICVGWDEI